MGHPWDEIPATAAMTCGTDRSPQALWRYRGAPGRRPLHLAGL